MTSIDYGHGLVNIDTETGIRYGVIHQGEVLQAWTDSSEPDYDDVNTDSDDFAPNAYILNDAEYSAIQHADDPDIFITRSPYYTLCAFCSPCAPGAGYLLSPGNVKAYCFSHDWWENGKAPYSVYRVADDTLIN